MAWSGGNAPVKDEIQRAKISFAQSRCWTIGAQFILGREERQYKRAGLWMLGQFGSRGSDPNCPRQWFWTFNSVSGYAPNRELACRCHGRLPSSPAK
jgi:hypothetical protein